MSNPLWVRSQKTWKLHKMEYYIMYMLYIMSNPYGSGHNGKNVYIYVCISPMGNTS